MGAFTTFLGKRLYTDGNEPLLAIRKKAVIAILFRLTSYLSKSNLEMHLPPAMGLFNKKENIKPYSLYMKDSLNEVQIDITQVHQINISILDDQATKNIAKTKYPKTKANHIFYKNYLLSKYIL